jgi:phosphate-selective porin OprO/OprP
LKSSSTTDIVDALVGKGVLTEEEGKLISKGHDTQKKAQPMIKEKDGAFSISSPNGKNSIQLTGRIHFDAKYNNIDPSDLYTSASTISNNDSDSKSMGSHFNMRRARIGIKGTVGGVADYLILANVQGSSILDEAFVDFNKYEPLGFKFGKFKQPLNLEIMTSSNNIDMMERSYVSQNAPEKRFGAMLHGEPKGYTYAGSIFQNNDSALSMEDHKLSTAGRATINFGEIMDNKDMIMHVGANAYSSNYQLQTSTTGNTNSNDSIMRGTLFSFQSGGQGVSNAYRAQVGGTPIDGTTGNYNTYNLASPNANNAHADNVGLEGILAYNNFKLQGEYSSAFYKSSNDATTDSISADVDTWYAEALWILTGEKYSDSYKKGAMGALKPKNEFNMDTGSGLGLWELGFRVDAFDVSNTSLKSRGTSSDAAASSRFQGSVDTINSKFDTCAGSAGSGTASLTGSNCGGGAQSYTASLKWILNPNLLFKANYTHTSFDNAFAPIDLGSSTARATMIKTIDHEDLLMFRGQLMF